MGIDKPSIVHDIAISHAGNSEDAMDEVVANAAKKMSSDWSTDARQIANKHFCDLAFVYDEFGIWMLTDTIIDPWQPIASAPKDGSVIRTCNKDNDLQDIYQWLDGKWTWLYGNGEMTHWKAAYADAIKEGA